MFGTRGDQTPCWLSDCFIKSKSNIFVIKKKNRNESVTMRVHKLCKCSRESGRVQMHVRKNVKEKGVRKVPEYVDEREREM